jgi:hypothetical protein
VRATDPCGETLAPRMVRAARAAEAGDGKEPVVTTIESITFDPKVDPALFAKPAA